MALIDVWDQKTGKKVRISEGIVAHKKLGKRYSRTPIGDTGADVDGAEAGKEPAEKKDEDM